MKLFRMRRAVSRGALMTQEIELAALYTAQTYDQPRLSELGRVRKLTLGSSSSGNADSNSQYYW